MNRTLYKLIYILLPILVIGCTNKADKLKNTIEKLRIKTDFKPLNIDEAYRFINEYYLPRLDTLKSKRKIFVYPISGINFKRNFESAKRTVELAYLGDTLDKKIVDVVLVPEGIDSTFRWDAKRLKNTKVIEASTSKKNYQDQSIAFEEFQKKYGYGYVYISYPQYNPHTKLLVITEWIENGDWCGTGRDQNFWYKRVGNRWVSN